MIFDTKILAFLVLLIVQVLVSLVYKFSQTKGKYTYSPLSAIASAEFIKLCISLTFIWFSVSMDEFTDASSYGNMIYNRCLACCAWFRKEVRKPFILYTSGLALLYVINNQLAFVLYLYVDMASISMFKSFSTIISAILLWAFCNRNITREQWGSIILQVVGLCIVQYDSCRNIPFLAIIHYITLIGSTLITGICSVWNERLIKTYSVNMHIQNAILYTFGLTLNLILFFFLPNLFVQHDSKKRFFEGYSLAVLAIILCNSVLGIVITFVYKYADVIVKTFSTACATGVLLYINVAVFKIKANLTVFLGAIVIFVSSYLFLLVKPVSTSPPTDVKPIVNDVLEKNEESKWMQIFRWKYRIVIFIIASFLFYFAASLSSSGTFFRSINNIYMTKMSSSTISITRIEEIRPNGTLIIHGDNLCSDKTLNVTRVVVNSDVCSLIDICSNTMISCSLPNMLRNRWLSGTVNINLTTSTHQYFTSITINTTIPYTSSLTYWKKNDIVLIIYFNKPHYEHISFLNIYRHLFPLVVFTGHESHSDVIQCSSGSNETKAYECLAQAILQYPNHNGYLFARYDLLPIFYRLENESLTSFWISQITCTTKLDSWFRWNTQSASNTLKKAFDQIKLDIQNTTFYEQRAENNFCHGFSNILYLPRRFIVDWLTLTKLFVRYEVSYEIGFSTIIHMITSRNISVNLETLSGTDFNEVSSIETLDDNSLIQFVHNIQHTLRSQKYWIEIVVYRSLLTTRN